MRIAFDISDLASGRADGTTRYTMELAKWLPRIGRQHEWLYVTPALDEEVATRLAGHNVKICRSPWPKYWTQARLPLELYRHQPEVLFMPIQQLPYVRPSRTKTVVVVHDLAVHKYPRQFTYKDWLLLHVFSAYAVREADRVIAISQATADDIARYYGRKRGVKVVRHGVDRRQWREPAGGAERDQLIKRLTERWPEAKERYVLFLGQIQPRKNLVRLVEAFEQLAATDTELRLVLAGGHGWRQQSIRQRINQSSARKRIHLVGTVPDSMLLPWFWQAQVFVLPSLYEGFGLPILEAMSSGCPVVTSNVSSMPEVADGAAVLIDPRRVESIAAGIKQGMLARDKLIEAGRKRVVGCSWEATARATLAVIEGLE